MSNVTVADIARHLGVSTATVSMTLRNKGPLWVIYPLTDHPELNKELYHSRMVWQLTALESK